jgi:hypothetical protein
VVFTGEGHFSQGGAFIGQLFGLQEWAYFMDERHSLTEWQCIMDEVRLAAETGLTPKASEV